MLDHASSSASSVSLGLVNGLRCIEDAGGLVTPCCLLVFPPVNVVEKLSFLQDHGREKE